MTGHTGLRPSGSGKLVDPENHGQRAEVSRGMKEAFQLTCEMKLHVMFSKPDEAAREKPFSPSSDWIDPTFVYSIKVVSCLGELSYSTQSASSACPPG